MINNRIKTTYRGDFLFELLVPEGQEIIMKGKWLDMMTRAEDECLYLKHQSGSTENELVMLRGFATSKLAASDMR